MKLHPRYFIVEKARVELHGMFLDWLVKHDVTWCEAARCVEYLLSTCLKYMLRLERHPNDPDRKADEE